MNLYWQPADGSGHPTPLTTSSNIQLMGSWHPNGQVLAFTWRETNGVGRFMTLRLEGDEVSGWRPGKPTMFLDEPSNEQQPSFSPDGHWLAYESKVEALRDLRCAVSGTGRQNRSRRTEAPMPSGRTTGASCSTWQPTEQKSWCHACTATGDDFRAEKPLRLE